MYSFISIMDYPYRSICPLPSSRFYILSYNFAQIHPFLYYRLLSTLFLISHQAIFVYLQCLSSLYFECFRFLLEESSLVCIIIPGSSVFKSCIWIVALAVVSVEIYMVRGSQCYLAVRVVLVNCCYPGFIPGDSCYASAAVI